MTMGAHKCLLLLWVDILKMAKNCQNGQNGQKYQNGQKAQNWSEGFTKKARRALLSLLKGLNALINSYKYMGLNRLAQSAKTFSLVLSKSTEYTGHCLLFGSNQDKQIQNQPKVLRNLRPKPEHFVQDNEKCEIIRDFSLLRQIITPSHYIKDQNDELKDCCNIGNSFSLNLDLIKLQNPGRTIMPNELTWISNQIRTIFKSQLDDIYDFFFQKLKNNPIISLKLRKDHIQIKTLSKHINTFRFKKPTSNTLKKHKNANFDFTQDDIINATNLVTKLRASARVKNLAINIIHSNVFSQNLKHKVDPQNNHQSCCLCGYYKANQSHQYNHCIYSQLIKKVFIKAYNLDYGFSVKPFTKYTYLGAVSMKDFTKQAAINIATLMHSANMILRSASSNKFIITSADDFIKLILKSCLRFSKLWPNNTFPSYLLNFTKIKSICPTEELLEIHNLPLSRFITPQVQETGLELSRLNELHTEHVSISKIFAKHFKVDINKTAETENSPKDPAVFKILRGMILNKNPERSLQSINQDF